MIVLDACVFIAHLDATDGHHDRAGELLLLATDQANRLGANQTTLAEVFVVLTRAGRVDQAGPVLGQLGLCAVGLPHDAVVTFDDVSPPQPEAAG
ncbi:MAG: hypothetical protein M3325_10425 [Actinomycetota bacterium]|nr:hypothetical protein [Actinomycetota bacterium]MDQ3905123.1 hypothetical protein [Actinomycetota bacterium]